MASKTKIITITIITAFVVAGMTVGSIWGISSYLDRQYASLHDGCSANRPNHTITIENDEAVLSNPDIYKCDTLTVTNFDTNSRMMAFGLHDKHVAYDGVTEKVLKKGESFTVTLIQTGNFIVHDHDNEAVKANFTVKE